MKKYTVLKINELKKLAKEEKNPRTNNRLKALLLLSKGVKVETICSVFAIHEDVLIYRWLSKWNNGGLQEVKDKYKKGRNPVLAKEHKQALREYVLSQDKRIVCKELVSYVKNKWDINCDRETIRQVLKNMKLSWQKPDKVNHKADEEKKKVFLKSAQWCQEGKS